VSNRAAQAPPSLGIGLGIPGERLPALSTSDERPNADWPVRAAKPLGAARQPRRRDKPRDRRPDHTGGRDSRLAICRS